jgi:hypothetical protein
VPEILVIGHTDLVGSNEYNDTLSLQRAQLIAGMLQQQGAAQVAGGDWPWHARPAGAHRQRGGGAAQSPGGGLGALTRGRCPSPAD